METEALRVQFIDAERVLAISKERGKCMQKHRFFLVMFMAILLGSVILLTSFSPASAHSRIATIANSTCSATYWQEDTSALKSYNGYYFDMEFYSLRDKYTYVYCGKVYELTGVYVPANNWGAYTLYNQYYTDGYYQGEGILNFSCNANVASGPYVNTTPAWSVVANHAAEIIPMLFNWQGTRMDFGIYLYDYPS